MKILAAVPLVLIGTVAIVSGGTMMTVVGTVSDLGVNCPTVLSDDGELLSFSDLPEALRPGDRVLLEISAEPPAFFGVCDQGRHVEWERITRQAASGVPEAVWTRRD